eukprot:scpid74657/ scgid24729/ Lipopolysaccharide-induced tumor necrosis factor-alpha factor homolog; Small integral membrane protein of lysosome/late endosome
MSNYNYDPLAKGDMAKGQTKPGTLPPYQPGPGSYTTSTKSSTKSVDQPKSAPTVNVGRVVTNFFQESPMSITCTHCNATVVSETRRVPNSRTWCLCATIFLLGGVLGCCLIPFYSDSCRDVEHRCPNCDVALGRWSPS